MDEKYIFLKTSRTVVLLSTLIYKNTICNYYENINFKNMLLYIIKELKENKELQENINNKKITTNELIMILLGLISKYIQKTYNITVVFFNKSIGIKNVTEYYNIISNMLDLTDKIYIAKSSLRGILINKFRQLLKCKVEKFSKNIFEEEKNALPTFNYNSSDGVCYNYSCKSNNNPV